MVCNIKGCLPFQLSKNNFKDSTLIATQKRNLNLNKPIGDDLIVNVSNNLSQLNILLKASLISIINPSKNLQQINKFSNSEIALLINDSLRYLRFGQF